VVPHIAGTAIAAGIGYLIVLRFGFPASSRDLGSAVRRILPDRLTTLVPRGRAALAGS
jgi:hypothetical protein